MTFTITNNTKQKLPEYPYEAMKNMVLGEKYELSFVIVDAKTIQQLNNEYRQKNNPTDILSFPLDEKSGEIFICPEETRKEAVKFDREYENFFAFLFIHGLTHLKGFDHGSTMEHNEQIIREAFGI